MPVMAPTRKKRDNAAQYFDVGVQGRRTGITLPENPRDSFGIENIDGVFSSPEKSPQRRAVENVDKTLSSADMDVASDSATNPTEVLIDRQVLRSTKAAFPPPSSRSPIKTHLGSSPRRLSAVAPRSVAPIRSATKSVARKLDFNHPDKPRQSIESLPDQRNGHSSPSKARSTGNYNTQPSPLHKGKGSRTNGRQSVDEHVVDDIPIDPELPAAGDDSMELLQEAYAGGDDYDDDDAEPVFIGEDSPPREIAESEQPEELPQSSPASAKRKRGRPPSATKARPPSVELGVNLGQDSPKLQKASQRQGNAQIGRSPQKLVNGFHSKAVGSKESVHQEIPQFRPLAGKRPPSAAATGLKKRGRPRKADVQARKAEEARRKQASRMPPPSFIPAKKASRQPTEEYDSPIEEELSEDEDEYQPEKRAKKSRSGSALAERDPNARTQSYSPSKSLWSQTSRRPTSRTLQILRENTPLDDNPTITRSGRRSVRPLDYWAGEKVERDAFGTIVNVVRSESVEVDKPSRKRGGGRKKAQRDARLDSIREEHSNLGEWGDGNLEEWEEEGEVQQGPVAFWNPESGMVEGEEERQLAWGINSVQTRDVANAHFKFGKYFNMPFMSTGILEFPVNGFKQVKHSGKMHLAFFVQYGKLEVTVHESVFNISAGGVWQVPSGNTYGIQNVSETPARVFFAQACLVDGDPSA